MNRRPPRYRQLQPRRRRDRAELHRPRQPHVDPGRNGGRGDPREHPRRVQPRRPVPRDHRVRPAVQGLQRQPVRPPRLQPRPLVHRVRRHRKVEHHAAPQVHARRPARHRRWWDRETGVVRYQMGHDLSRHADRLIKAGPLVLERPVHVLVPAVERGLLLPAHHQHRGPQHHQRPQRFGLHRRQRPHRVKRAHRGQHRARLGPGVPQHRRDRHRQLAHRPRPGQVAEVDHPVRRPPPVHDGAHHVVVGHVAVDRLPRQLPGQRLDPPPGPRRRLGHPRPQPRVPHMLRQHSDHPVGVPQIPLQHPLEPRMPEPAQRPAHPPRHRAEPRHHPRRQVPAPGQRPPGQVPQHPHDRRLTTHRSNNRPVRHRPRPQPGRGHQFRRRVLRLDLGPAERRIRDLQHARHRPAVPPQQEVAILLAPERKSQNLHDERRCREPHRLLRAHDRHRQPAASEEVDPDAIRG